MPYYFANENELSKALKSVKRCEETKKIVYSLEARNAPHHWIQMALNRYYELID